MGQIRYPERHGFCLDRLTVLYEYRLGRRIRIRIFSHVGQTVRFQIVIGHGVEAAEHRHFGKREDKQRGFFQSIKINNLVCLRFSDGVALTCERLIIRREESEVRKVFGGIGRIAVSILRYCLTRQRCIGGQHGF